MAIVVASGVTLSTAANTKTADLVTGVNQFVPNGRLQFFAKGSAAGMNVSLTINGVPLIDDQAIPSFGATGSLSVNDNGVVDQAIKAGRVQLFLRNTTGGALTTDYLVLFTPSGK